VPRGAVFYGGRYWTRLASCLSLRSLRRRTRRHRPHKYATPLRSGRLVRLNEYAGDAAVFIVTVPGSGASGIAAPTRASQRGFYYSTLTGDAALVDARHRTSHPHANAVGMVEVTARRSPVETVPGVQEVFATFTATSGPLVGVLEVDGADRGHTGGRQRKDMHHDLRPETRVLHNTYTGVIDPADGQASRVSSRSRVDIQAVR